MSISGTQLQVQPHIRSSNAAAVAHVPFTVCAYHVNHNWYSTHTWSGRQLEYVLLDWRYATFIGSSSSLASCADQVFPEVSGSLHGGYTITTLSCPGWAAQEAAPSSAALAMTVAGAAAAAVVAVASDFVAGPRSQELCVVAALIARRVACAPIFY